MPDWNKLLESKSAQRLMKDGQTVERLKNAPESQRLMELLAQNGDVEQMAASAANGQSAPLMGAIRKLMEDPESRRLLEQISQNLPL